MRKFQKTYRARVLWILGMSLGFQLGLGVALEQGYISLRDPECLLKLASLRAHLAKRPLDRPLVVLLGSSRVGVNVRPQSLPPWPGPSAHPPLVFNAALCRSGPILEYLMLRRLLAEGIRPDWALVEVTPAFFNDCAYSGDAVVPQRLRGRELRWIRPYSSRPKFLYRQWLADRLCPAYSYRFTVLSWFAPHLLPSPLSSLAFDWRGLDGEGWLYLPWFRDAGDRLSHKKRLELVCQSYAAGFPCFRPEPRSDQALHELLRCCRRHKIRVALMHMPDPFREYYSPEAQGAIRSYVQGLSRDYAVPVVDMKDWVEDRDFYDGVHLTHAGVAAFTERFGREVLWPLLAGRCRHCSLPRGPAPSPDYRSTATR